MSGITSLKILLFFDFYLSFTYYLLMNKTMIIMLTWFKEISDKLRRNTFQFGKQIWR